MSRQVRIASLFALAATIVLGSLVGIRPYAGAQAPPNAAVTAPKAKSAQPLKRSEIMQMLSMQVDLTPLVGKQPKLGEFLTWIQKQTEAKAGKPLPILVDREQFKHSDPDAPPFEDWQLRFVDITPQMSVASALRLALDQIPTNNATFLIRQGRVEVTTNTAGNPYALLIRRIVAEYKNRPLAEVLEDLSEQAGLAIVLDARVAEKAKTPVSATFVNNSSLGSAVVILADMAGLEAVMVRDVVYVTTPDNAKKLNAVQLPILPLPPGIKQSPEGQGPDLPKKSGH